MGDIGFSDNGDVLYTNTELVAVITSNEQRWFNKGQQPIVVSANVMHFIDLFIELFLGRIRVHFVVNVSNITWWSGLTISQSYK